MVKHKKKNVPLTDEQVAAEMAKDPIPPIVWIPPPMALGTKVIFKLNRINLLILSFIVCTLYIYFSISSYLKQLNISPLKRKICME